MPDFIPNLSPSYPATLFGGLSPDDEHVTVWEPSTGKTVAGNAAPYRRNLTSWLDAHPGWEEKADELKSSKRRSAARRSRVAAQAFAAVCCYPVATFLAADAAARLNLIMASNPNLDADKIQWNMEDFVRLQECLSRLAQQVHKISCNVTHLDSTRWANITRELGESKDEGTVVLCSYHMLSRGAEKSLAEIPTIRATLPAQVGSVMERSILPSSVIGSPQSPADLTATTAHPFIPGQAISAPNTSMNAALVLERSFRAPREPRVTVWNPKNGRTISGNAAPCRRNLRTWMDSHPGWYPKEEGQLSSSRRNRNRKVRPASVPVSIEKAPITLLVQQAQEQEQQPQQPVSPHFHDALEGLLVLSQSPQASFERLKMMRLEGLSSASTPANLSVTQGGSMMHLRGVEPSKLIAHNAKDDDSDMGDHDDDDDASDVDEDGNNMMQDRGFVPMSSVSCSSLEDAVAMSDDDDDDGEDAEHSDMEM